MARYLEELTRDKEATPEPSLPITFLNAFLKDVTMLSDRIDGEFARMPATSLDKKRLQPYLPSVKAYFSFIIQQTVMGAGTNEGVPATLTGWNTQFTKSEETMLNHLSEASISSVPQMKAVIQPLYHALWTQMIDNARDATQPLTPNPQNHR